MKALPNNYFNNYPHLHVYWDRFLERKLSDHVYTPFKEKKIDTLWTNNNSESLNNRLKQVADWKQYKLPELIEKVTLVSKIQLMDLRRSLRGLGNFIMSGGSERFLIDPMVWQNKTSNEKEELFNKFLASKKIIIPTNSKFSSAGTFDYKCPLPKLNAGKKPGQRRRAKAERTNTRHDRDT